MVQASDPSAAEVKRVNQQLEERHYEFRSNCNEGEGDASACHNWGEWLAVVDKNYTDAGDSDKRRVLLTVNNGYVCTKSLHCNCCSQNVRAQLLQEGIPGLML